MFEFEGILDNFSATPAFVIACVNAIVIAVSIATWLSLRPPTDHPRSARSASRLETAAKLVLAVVFLLACAGVGLNLVNSHQQAAAAPAAKMSIDDIHGSVDTKAPPVQEVADVM